MLLTAFFVNALLLNDHHARPPLLFGHRLHDRLVARAPLPVLSQELNGVFDLDNVTKGATSFIEKTVRGATGNEGYQFGDYTRGAVAEVQEAVNEVGAKVTGIEDYEFGDLV